MSILLYTIGVALVSGALSIGAYKLTSTSNKSDMDNCCQTLFNLGIEYQQISKWSVALWCSESVAKWLRGHRNMAGFTFTEAQTPGMWYIIDFEGAQAICLPPGITTNTLKRYYHMDTYVPKHRASVEAFQYFHPLKPHQREWLGDSFITDHKSGLRIYGDGPSDGGISAVLDVGPGDWVVESHGALRVMTDHEFNRTYEPQ